MKDRFNREINYLRISLTDKCNLRCRYCMPEDGVQLLSHCEILSENEFIDAARAAAELGIHKIRITGGEPLVKKNLISICSKIKNVDGINELCITTNGIRLKDYAKDLVAAGVSRINLSLDTLDNKKFEYISRRPAPENLLEPLETALTAGFKKVKINTVLIGGFNDDEIPALADLTRKYPVDVRFIELMPMYDSGDFGPDAFISGDTVLEVLDLIPLESDGSVARRYKLEGAKGEIGLISAVTCSFCSSCNRIRLTADGKIKPCLHSDREIPIKGLLKDEIKDAMIRAILEKPACHPDLSYEHRSNSKRNMNKIGG